MQIEIEATFYLDLDNFEGFVKPGESNRFIGIWADQTMKFIISLGEFSMMFAKWARDHVPAGIYTLEQIQEYIDKHGTILTKKEFYEGINPARKRSLLSYDLVFHTKNKKLNKLS